ncbi:gamma-glutamylcyclotransferase family protein [Cryptosporangium minutisporangium]|uniref:Putative gamma-glutamylcyclotransferase n=1 Tax=Cryptosporangium minutisporangium TaxID=113569 RepID=A0ABP6TAJ1_9ACTN
MTDRLFVYGSLAPGRPNEHVLADLAGTWEPATIRGHLRKEGWGADLGYPGIVLDERGPEVEGLVFTARSLGEHWERLDEFEGDGYRRVLAAARCPDGRTVSVHVYTLATDPGR